MVDPYLHTAVIEHGRDLAERFGVGDRQLTRAGFTVPGRLTNAAFGDLGGYYAWRYILVLLAIVPAYLLFCAVAGTSGRRGRRGRGHREPGGRASVEHRLPDELGDLLPDRRLLLPRHARPTAAGIASPGSVAVASSSVSRCTPTSSRCRWSRSPCWPGLRSRSYAERGVALYELGARRSPRAVVSCGLSLLSGALFGAPTSGRRRGAPFGC